MLAICLALINDDEDKKSFEQLVKKFEKKLYTESFKILRSHELAEEAVWETFYRIADNFSNKICSAFLRYLYTAFRETPISLAVSSALCP